MQVFFSPLTACKSLSINALGAYRLYVLAKALAGVLDSVLVSEVENFALTYISKRQYQRNKSAALRLGLLTVHQRKNSQSVFVLVSHAQAALLLGATKSSEDNRAAVSLDDLFSDKWQAIAFTAWQAKYTENGVRLTSQKKQAELTGIQPQMQRKYNKICGVVSRSNYAVSNISANQLDMVKEFGRRAAPFAFKDYKLNQTYIAWRLPSSRVVCADSSTLNPLGIEGSLISTNPNTRKGGSRLFVYGDTTFTKAKKTVKGDNIHDLYVFSRVADSGAGIFTHFSI
ncbi:MAG: hypothetical protein KDD74_09135 [Anaerolineales bacterium]|nr:hypothetical protein [Anaerolineales bacterium]